MLVIDDLHVVVDGKHVLNGATLSVRPGEIHVIVGQNGSGKSTLAGTIVGNPSYELKRGYISYNDADITLRPPEERARQGIFMGFQTPLAIPGMPLISFLRTTVNSVREAQGRELLSTKELIDRAKETAQALGISESFLERPLNVGFSGGEKKRVEILQMAMLEPKLIILDEIDSGLDRDALGAIAAFLQSFITQDRSLMLISHYIKLVELLPVTHVHLFHEGRIIVSGGKELAYKIEEEGYDALIRSINA